MLAHGTRAGVITVKFGDRGLGSVVRRLKLERLRATLSALGVVALIALVVSLLISRQITLPLERVLAAIRARGAGDRSIRIGQARGTGVIQELCVALNESNDAIDQRDRLQKNLVAGIAHELRTPVAVLQASHEAMLDGLTPPTTENLWSLRDEVLKLARMIEDLQRLAAAEAAALQLTLRPGDLSDIAAESADSLSDAFGAASINLVKRLNPAPIMCDPGRMREVITNLLTNAEIHPDRRHRRDRDTPRRPRVSPADSNRHRHRHPAGRIAPGHRKILPRPPIIPDGERHRHRPHHRRRTRPRPARHPAHIQPTRQRHPGHHHPSGRDRSLSSKVNRVLSALCALNSIILAADANFVIHDNPAVLDLARQLVHQRLGLGSNAKADGR